MRPRRAHARHRQRGSAVGGAAGIARLVGVLALQGDFREHRAVLRSLGVQTREVRRPEDLPGIDALVIPGGESTTMGRLAAAYGLVDAIRDAGVPLFGTCAGLIFMARDAVDGVSGQALLGVADVVVRRNGYGRQVHSFEADIDVKGVKGGPLRGVFIRAPVVEKIGAAVEVLAELDGRPVVLRQGPHLMASFHPELSGDARLHQLFLGARSS